MITFLLYLVFIILGLAVHPLFFIPLVIILLYISVRSLDDVPYTPTVTTERHTPNTTENQLYLFLYTKRMYLKSDLWQQKRTLVFKRDNFTCQLCGSTSALEAHHMRDYALIPNEPISSIITLCRNCHQHQHDKHGQLITLHDYITWNNPI